jgi:hypothetical protein
MAKSERQPSKTSEGVEHDLKTVAMAGPAGVALVTVIVLAILAAIVFGLMILLRR